MKTLKISLLLLTFFLAACKKEKLTKDDLPPVTQEGKKPLAVLLMDWCSLHIQQILLQH